ncbi:MAG: short-chain dehydrogenase [Hydrogenophilales bacterium CG03_land_8_20_14_0_80_62_28]|nr:SDR family NAD(P)-dependent oxidoreductase [Betaproteobacteria bacterium]OIO77705.1 MAG: short-chain dehydrogenase [Hydrogenophilaceae bacterium CG1_02_62_390]PIV24684.1 MAG: short-chain dehydrogenase [Hydrogenophilales bacterium CG03_land_8_20_14_0_80_62_28]PIW38542.1 MAG: short-chain dehydrogenase [Hydrogenophilales bacterium CG15_BIG_FIL_POST_REV_8_21_14_020_62_31]PIW71293.1 MAG: short-chain dehydrogenase [Hydrogenophilales bacterium CG12_big_fil_rev_8_21_14_0_65_61_21]PIX02087.1 MAG: sh
MISAKSILVTGCSTGIGYAVAHGLKARGWRVFATARKPADVERLIGEGLESLALDLNDSGSIRAAFTEVMIRTGGRLDALFNNGGYGQVGAVEDLPRAALREQFETNLFGWIELTNLVVPVMRRQGHGRIVMNSSVLGYAAFPYRGAYNAVKFALEGIADTLRMELAGTGIEVCLVEPGPIISRFRENCRAPFERHIDWRNSVHRGQYKDQLARLAKPGPAAPFTLPPEAVLAKAIHALESRRPRPRYQVTVPAVLFWRLKRFLSTRAMDWLSIRASGGGKR